MFCYREADGHIFYRSWVPAAPPGLVCGVQLSRTLQGEPQCQWLSLPRRGVKGFGGRQGPRSLPRRRVGTADAAARTALSRLSTLSVNRVRQVPDNQMTCAGGASQSTAARRPCSVASRLSPAASLFINTVVARAYRCVERAGRRGCRRRFWHPVVPICQLSPPCHAQQWHEHGIHPGIALIRDSDVSCRSVS